MINMMKLKSMAFSFVLTLAMVVGLLPGMSLTAYATPTETLLTADAAPTETLLTTITATGTEQASYSVANVATVSFSNLPNYSSYYTANWGWWGTGWSATVTPAEGYTITKCVFYDDTNHTATDSESPFVVETTDSDKKPKVNGAFIYDSIDSHGVKKIEVYGYVPVTGVELSQSEVSLGVGDLEMLTATVSPEYATDKKVKWSITDGADKVKLYSDATCTTEISTAATDTMTIYVKAEAAGSATVKVESNSDSTKSATCAVTVTSPSTYTVTIPATLDVKNAGWNATKGISATGALTNGKKLTVTASSDGEFALVNQSDNTQKVSYKLAATSTDTEAATSWEFTELSNAATTKPMGIIVEDYSSMPAGIYQDTVTFTSSVVIPVTKIQLDQSTLDLKVGGATATLNAIVSPYRATDKTLTWSSDKENVATVSNGVVTPVGAGTATITATANDGSGVKATCAVTVTVPVTSVTINNAPTEPLFVNSTGTLTATVSPDHATNKTVTWSSSDPDYVSINATTGEYEVKGTKGYGSATITATAGDKTATCTITGKVTYTSLKAGDVIHVGDTVYATSTIYVKYGSTNSSISKNLGVYTLINDSGTYKWTTSVNPVSTRISATSGPDGIYVVSGGGASSSDRITFAAHTN